MEQASGISQGWSDLAEFARSSVCFVADVPHATVQQWMYEGISPLKFPKGFNSACYWSEGRRVALHAYVRSCHTFRKKPRLEFSIAGGAITRICAFGGH